MDNGTISADLVGETVKVYSDDNTVYCENGVFSYNIINTKGDIVASAFSRMEYFNYYIDEYNKSKGFQRFIRDIFGPNPWKYPNLV